MDRESVVRSVCGISLALFLVLSPSGCSSKSSQKESAKAALDTMRRINSLDLTVEHNRAELKKYCTPKGYKLLLAVATAKESHKNMLAPPYSGPPSITNGVCRIPMADPPFIQKGYFKVVVNTGAAGVVHKLLSVLGDNKATWKLDDIFIASGSSGEMNIFYSDLLCQDHITRVVRQDRQVTDLFSKADHNHPNWPQDYLATIQRINIADCPGDFQKAYKNLVKAGQRILYCQSWKLARMAFFSPVDDFAKPDEFSRDEQRALRKWIDCREDVIETAISYGVDADTDVWRNAKTHLMHQADIIENHKKR